MTKKTKKKSTQTATTNAARKSVARLGAATEQRRGTSAAVLAGMRAGKTAAAATHAAARGDSIPAEGTASKHRWKDLSDAELRALYAEKVRRPTDSTNRRYLILRILAAEQGRIATGLKGPRIKGPKTPVTIIFGDEVLAELDATAKADGFGIRLPYLRTLFSEALRARGHADLAARLVG